MENRILPIHFIKTISSAETGVTGNLVNPTIVLHSTNLPSISKGSVVLYRQFEVGKIINVRPKANNFDIDVYIYPAYQDLLTDKSVFWVESAAQIDITPKGISIQASPVARSLKGAISLIIRVQAKIKHFIQVNCELNQQDK